MAVSSHLRRAGGRPILGAALAAGLFALALGPVCAQAQSPAPAASPNVPPRPIGVARISGTVTEKTVWNVPVDAMVEEALFGQLVGVPPFQLGLPGVEQE